MAIPAIARIEMGRVLKKRVFSSFVLFCMRFAMNSSKFNPLMLRALKNKHFLACTLLWLFLVQSLLAQNITFNTSVVTGADQLNEYLPLLKGKRVGVAANQTSVIKNTHIVDTLLSLGIKVVRVFSPEHGFRGVADAGEHLKSYKDAKTGVPIISLYGKHYKPKPSEVKDLDIILFDIQDVGARFYTYISTMHYLMESCAENHKTFLLLDRPNPNGFMIDGPVLDTVDAKSFVGMHPIPIVHGCTIGELAQMVNEEGWLKHKVKCDLKIIKLKDWKHSDLYQLPIKPSPNLPSFNSILFYPSLCLFEGTKISMGRGTEKPFEQFGHPGLKGYDYSFTPRSITGASKNPPFESRECFGKLLNDSDAQIILSQKQIQLKWLLECYEGFGKSDTLFNNFFKRLAGTKELKKQILSGMNEDAIRASWQPALDAYKEKRKKYLLYEE